MADFTTANLPGANEAFNTARDKFSTIKDTLKSNMEVEASSLTTTLKSDLLDFGDKLQKMIPELPDLPDINLQAELTSIQELVESPAAFDAAFASLESKFGDGLIAQGEEIGDLLEKATDAFASGKKISVEIPNFTVPAAGGDVIKKANEVLQADKDGLEELLSDEVNQETIDALKKSLEESQEIQQEALVAKLKEVTLEPIGYIKKDTNTFLSDDETQEIEEGLKKLTQESFQSTSVETTTGGGSTTTYKDGTVVRTAADGTETVISGPTA